MLPESGVFSACCPGSQCLKELSKTPKYSRKEKFHWKGKSTSRSGSGPEQEKRGSKGLIIKASGFLLLFAVGGYFEWASVIHN